MYYLLIYDFVPDYLERREAHRDAHLALANAAVEKGGLLLAGALVDPADKGLLLLQGESPAVAERFAASDPYVHEGIVTRWEVRPWNLVAGAGVERLDP